MRISAKRIVAIILVVLLAIGIKSILKQFRNSDTVLGRISELINRDNSIIVSSRTLDLDEIQIKWKSEFDKAKIVFEKQRAKDKIGNEYGKNSFFVNYKQKAILKVSHFKTNNWHTHDYLFNIEEDRESLIISFEAIGPDELKSFDTIPLAIEN